MVYGTDESIKKQKKISQNPFYRLERSHGDILVHAHLS